MDYRAAGRGSATSPADDARHPPADEMPATTHRRRCPPPHRQRRNCGPPRWRQRRPPAPEEEPHPDPAAEEQPAPPRKPREARHHTSGREPHTTTAAEERPRTSTPAEEQPRATTSAAEAPADAPPEDCARCRADTPAAAAGGPAADLRISGVGLVPRPPHGASTRRRHGGPARGGAIMDITRRRGLARCRNGSRARGWRDHPLRAAATDSQGEPRARRCRRPGGQIGEDSRFG